MDHGGRPTWQTELDEVFRLRAAELAVRRDQAREDAGTLHVLAFALGGERYALALSDLAGVFPLGRVTSVPGAPAELLGVINHRGRVCCLLDLARLLGLPLSGEDAGPAYVLLLRRPAPAREVGLKVGAIDRLLRVGPDAGAEPPSSEGPAAPYLRALTAARLHLLSAEALLCHPLLNRGGQQ